MSPSTAIHSYVALGDSFTEGLGDPHPQYPRGCRGWSERVAEELAVHNPRLRYANLAVRGHHIADVKARQLPQAIAMKPDIVTIYAGYNDLLTMRVNFTELAKEYDSVIARLVDSHAAVIMWTAHDIGWAPVHRHMRGRAAIYSEIVREIADRHGAEVVDFWRMNEYRDLRMWNRDRIHMSPLGHQRMAEAVLDTIEAEHSVHTTPLPPPNPSTALHEYASTLEWLGKYVAPWLGRQVRGRSSGDGIQPKRPELKMVRPAA
ncbi:SGNH/GDSL hydrolase family protein [Hoyosella rhizosphaerae]|uniref:SGNH hydrolase n=1 Tax=Hoyosella rhizosphaerae TaxID=1755582 RepID=A0A916XDW7_9ACTN|nr:SGNH/GDSL hydrolase family protein [Hoyosella rhizosphaerae]MBN4927578.1 SGNH/GDSL hydrolase family protein [Hoyosella rhizosphaerae]GGC63359.1 SGNH hydrolase [Hoyosella rhizosphaerae]